MTLHIHRPIDRSIDLSNAHLQRFEEFKKLYERATNDLENLHVLLLDNKAIRADETEQALRTCARLNGDVKVSLDATLTNGEFFWGCETAGKEDSEEWDGDERHEDKWWRKARSW